MQKDVRKLVNKRWYLVLISILLLIVLTPIAMMGAYAARMMVDSWGAIVIGIFTLTVIIVGAPLGGIVLKAMDYYSLKQCTKGIIWGILVIGLLIIAYAILLSGIGLLIAQS